MAVSLNYMAYQLSAQSEQFLASVVAGGLFSTKEAALEAAVAALREKNRLLPAVPDEHVELVEEAIAAALDGHLREFKESDWSQLRQYAREVANRSQQGRE